MNDFAPATPTESDGAGVRESGDDTSADGEHVHQSDAFDDEPCLSRRRRTAPGFRPLRRVPSGRPLRLPRPRRRARGRLVLRRLRARAERRRGGRREEDDDDDADDDAEARPRPTEKAAAAR